MVSIVLPTYNGEKYLRTSIESVLRQSEKEWELIIVDDCSTDSTLKIAQEYAGKDPRIKVIHNEINKKLPASLNVGFKNAKGEYLTWTSDDNEYNENAIKKMRDYLDLHKNINMVCAGMYYIDKDGQIVGEYVKYSDEYMYYNCCVGACFLYRKKVYEEIGGYDETKFGIEDYEYWLRILENYGTIGYIDEKLYKYRIHEASLTATKWCEIKTRLNVFRKNKIDVIYSKLKDNKRYLAGIYFDMCITDDVDKTLFEKYFKEIKELGTVRELPIDSKKVIIYGAGEFGKKAFDILGNRASFFADRSRNKIGTIVNGLEVISPEKMIEIKDNYEIVIALESINVLPVIHMLTNAGVKNVSVFQMIY